MKEKHCKNIRYKKKIGYCKYLRFNHMSYVPWCDLNCNWVGRVSLLKCKPHKEIKPIAKNTDAEVSRDRMFIPDGHVMVEINGVLVPVKIEGN